MEERQSATRKILERLKQDENLKGSMGGKRTFNWSMRCKWNRCFWYLRCQWEVKEVVGSQGVYWRVNEVVSSGQLEEKKFYLFKKMQRKMNLLHAANTKLIRMNNDWNNKKYPFRGYAKATKTNELKNKILL